MHGQQNIKLMSNISLIKRSTMCCNSASV